MLRTYTIIILSILSILFLDRLNNKLKEEKTTNKIVDEEKQNQPIEKEIIKSNSIFAKDYKEALELSAKNNKNIFIFFEADWCSWCKKMKSEVLDSKEISSELESKYIILYVDVDNNKILSTKYKVKSIPEFLILSKDEDVLIRNSGYLNSEQFLSIINSKHKTILK